MPYRIAPSNTDGWKVIVGDLGSADQPRLEIWLDRFPSHEQRKLYACFCSTKSPRLLKLAKKVSARLPPVRIVSEDDTADNKFVRLNDRLRRSEFNLPIIEKYKDATFFGIYDYTAGGVNMRRHFCRRAVSFFEEVARAAGKPDRQDESREVYPQYENRKGVVSHLQRERSRYLATERKLLDRYQCQGCGFRFEDKYGSLGVDFAEAHHIVPLSKLNGRVKTRIEDLRTVCANCHRMLHRMKGERGDIVKLRRTLKRNS